MTVIQNRKLSTQHGTYNEDKNDGDNANANDNDNDNGNDKYNDNHVVPLGRRRSLSEGGLMEHLYENDHTNSAQSTNTMKDGCTALTSHAEKEEDASVMAAEVRV